MDSRGARSSKTDAPPVDGRSARKARSHEKIVDAASRMLRKHGPSGVSVDALMEEAGLTRGGFYAHFESKDALVAAALERAFDEQIDVLFRAGKDKKGQAKLEALAKRYLTPEHVALPELGCPAPALGGDVARGGNALKRVFERKIEKLVGKLVDETGVTRSEALAIVSAWFGALLVARAAGNDALTSEILSAVSVKRTKPRKV